MVKGNFNKFTNLQKGAKKIYENCPVKEFYAFHIVNISLTFYKKVQICLTLCYN